MELLKEILQIYMERREWFLELFGQHLKIAGIAIVLAGIMGLLFGIFIAEKEFMGPVILTLANIFYDSIYLFIRNFDTFYRNRR